MFSPVPRLGKNITTDTSVKARIFDVHSLEVVREVDVPIEAGSDIVLDILGLHMNRRLFTTFLINLCLPNSFSFILQSTRLGSRC
jgi:phage-related protein